MISSGKNPWICRTAEGTEAQSAFLGGRSQRKCADTLLHALMHGVNALPAQTHSQPVHICICKPLSS